MPPAAYRSIGQVLNSVKNEFPDISISKIRFLESEGLLCPERAPSGYRRYVQEDIDRLRYILTMQRDHYLPLKVIREHIDAMDRGLQPPTIETVTPEVAAPAMTVTIPQSVEQDDRPVKFTRRELVKVSGISEATLIELERQQMVLPRSGSIYYGREALTVCIVTRRLQAYGMDTRHLRAIKQSAEREAGIVEQAVQPYLRRSSKEAADVIKDVKQLVVHAHAAILHTLLQR